MKAKSFVNNPALAFISQSDTQEVTHDVVHKTAHKNRQNAAKKAAVRENTKDIVQEEIQEVTQEATQEAVQEYTQRKYIRTQGRKGHKKPRINMAFDNLDEIRKYAEIAGKSITQFVNDVVMDFIEARERGK